MKGRALKRAHCEREERSEENRERSARAVRTAAGPPAAAHTDPRVPSRMELQYACALCPACMGYISDAAERNMTSTDAVLDEIHTWAKIKGELVPLY